MPTIKVQLPANDSSPSAEALIYDQKRSQIQQRPLFKHEFKLMGEKKKKFFIGHWTSFAGWVIQKELPDQDW